MKTTKVHGIDCLFDESKDCATCEANPKSGWKQSTAPIAPAVAETEYRMLELGETIQEGDEFEFGGAWLLTHRIGSEAPAYIAYRRKITPVAPVKTAFEMKAEQQQKEA